MKDAGTTSVQTGLGAAEGKEDTTITVSSPKSGNDQKNDLVRVDLETSGGSEEPIISTTGVEKSETSISEVSASESHGSLLKSSSPSPLPPPPKVAFTRKISNKAQKRQEGIIPDENGVRSEANHQKNLTIKDIRSLSNTTGKW